MARDHRNEFLPISAANVAITGNGVSNGAIIDTEGTVSNTFIVDVANYTDGTYVFEFFDSEDSGMSGETAIIDDKLRGTEAGLTIAGAIVQGNNLGSIGVVGTKRFVRVKITASSVTTGADVSVTVVQETRVTPSDGISV